MRAAARLALAVLLAGPAPSAWAQGATGPGWVPPGLSAAEQREWKGGQPPGWSRGPAAETGACASSSTACASRARTAAADERDAVERLRRWGRERGVQAAVLESAVVSVEGAARRGVPVATAERLVRAAAERGIPPRGIEAITRALAYGAERDAVMTNLESFVRESLNAGAAPDAIALGVYRLGAAARPQ